MRLAIAPLLVLFTAACGDMALVRPTGLPITTYPSGRDFTMTLVMDRCRQSCEAYSPSECGVTVNSEDRRIEVSPRVPFERIDNQLCNEDCQGAAVLAHCQVPALTESGEWTVQSSEGLFSRIIVIR